MNRNLPWICLGLGALKFVPNAKVKLVGNSQGNPPEHGIPNLKLPMTFHFMLNKLWIESPSHCCCSFLLALSMLYIRSWLHLIAVVQGNHIHGLIRTYYPSTCKCSDQIKIIHHLWKAKKKTWIKIHPSLIFHLGGGGGLSLKRFNNPSPHPERWMRMKHNEASLKPKGTWRKHSTLCHDQIWSHPSLYLWKKHLMTGVLCFLSTVACMNQMHPKCIYIYTNLISCKN